MILSDIYEYVYEVVIEQNLRAFLDISGYLSRDGCPLVKL